jgi:hypothetical protein
MYTIENLVLAVAAPYVCILYIRILYILKTQQRIIRVYK